MACPEERRVIILPARPAGICPWCTALDISPIYVHGTDRDGNGGLCSLRVYVL